jgi:hypothetical protein
MGTQEILTFGRKYHAPIERSEDIWNILEKWSAVVGGRTTRAGGVQRFVARTPDPRRESTWREPPPGPFSASPPKFSEGRRQQPPPVTSILLPSCFHPASILTSKLPSNFLFDRRLNS